MTVKDNVEFDNKNKVSYTTFVNRGKFKKMYVIGKNHANIDLHTNDAVTLTDDIAKKYMNVFERDTDIEVINGKIPDNKLDHYQIVKIIDKEVK